MKCQFNAFRAVDDRVRSLAFHQGHSKILSELGIDSLTSNLPLWMDDPNVLVINVTLDDDEVVGGIRVHKYDGTNDLPIMSAIKDQDQNIVNFINRKNEISGVSESCGLWNSKRVYGQGISPLLARTSVALSSSFDSSCLVCFSAPYTKRMIKGLGFTEILEIGVEGSLPYPTEKFISTALVIDNIYHIERGEQANLDRISSLIEYPNQTFHEQSQGKELEVTYNLLGKNAYRG